MKTGKFVFFLLVVFGLVFSGQNSLAALSRTLFSTGFEATEGYSQIPDLIGQNGWEGSGNGGNGIVSNFFPNLGQQAYIGFTPPAAGETLQAVWQPINFNPLAANLPLVTFSVRMSVIVSSNGFYDDFRWAFYNTNSTRLFMLDFDNTNLRISYFLDDANGFQFTGLSFSNAVEHTLVVTMDFSANRWSSTFDGKTLTTNLPITTVNTPLHLGDVDAFWVVRTANQPGDNFMLFDNYEIIARSRSPTPVLYETGFEPHEGFDKAFYLTGQGGWIGEGSGGNGLLTNLFTGLGQQAYLGVFAPTNQETVVSVWRPLDVAPVSTNVSRIRFSVVMAIIDSTNGFFDDFRWSVYNTNGHRLFTLDFDNSSLEINYVLDNSAGFIYSGRKFQNNVTNHLEIEMDFNGNTWSAFFNGAPVAAGLPITTVGAPLNLGDIDAVWSIRNPAAPGDNFMAFDNYRLLAESIAMRPTVELLRTPGPNPLSLRLTGEPSRSYIIERSTNLLGWSPFSTNVLSSESQQIPIASTGSVGFYRARLGP